MPAAIIMENGIQKPSRTDHDRETKMNNTNGAHADASENAVLESDAPGKGGQATLAYRTRWNDLPDDIGHITDNFISLSKFLTRLSQRSHNSLQRQLLALSKMPSSPASKGDLVSTKKPDAKDFEEELDPVLAKKLALLNWAQELHTQWVKALVITEWSRKVDQVSKVIDLNAHLFKQLELYNTLFNQMINVKRDLTFARIPSPDLKTALHVLSSGAATWLPDQNYIEPQPLTAHEQVKWLTDLDTLISLRLNLDDFERIPNGFRNYSINSGRVTFKVLGEFEVDLTIADENFEKQFWFIDFRFDYTPAAQTLTENMRKYLDLYTNDALSKGLIECYQFLHEFVLTAKINELKRQAFQLSKGVWAGQLMVEPLKRALAIQYWTERRQSTGSKSWILVAVDSGRKKGEKAEDKTSVSSRVCVKWYRDNKEVTDASIPFDSSNLSTESLLKAAVGRHVGFLLRGIHDKLKETARFQKREATMALHISDSNPAASSLRVQVGHSIWVTLMVELATGAFALKPHSRFSAPNEYQLNMGKDPIEDGARYLEHIRCSIMEDELSRRGSPMGWLMAPSPLSPEELRLMPKARDTTRTLWLQRRGWPSSWFIGVFLSLRGDEWWLLEAAATGSRAPRLQAYLPLHGGYLLSPTFWQNLFLLATSMIAQTVDIRALHSQRIKHQSCRINSPTPSTQIYIPMMQIALSSIFPSMVTEISDSHPTLAEMLGIGSDKELASIMQSESVLSLSPKQAWANDIVCVKFKGVRAAWKKASDEGTGADAQGQVLMCVSDAIIKVSKPARLASLKGLVDNDVSYHPRRGEFCIRISHALGEPVLEILKSRIKAIDRFVTYHEALGKMQDSITCKSATLRTVICSYGEPIEAEDVSTKSPQRQWTIMLDLSQDAIEVQLERGNPHLRVLDVIQRLVNVEGGIKALLTWLPVSLPLLNAIDSVTAGWDDLAVKDQGRVDFCMRMMDWMSIRYTIRATDSAGNKFDQVLKLEARIRVRRGELWWHLWRAERLTPSSSPDSFDAVLQPIFHGKGEGWQGLASSTAAIPKQGMANLLRSVDGAVKALIGQMDSDEPRTKQDVHTQPQLQVQTQTQTQAAMPQQQQQFQLQPAAIIHRQTKVKQANRGGKQAPKGRTQGASAQTAVVIE